MPGESVRAKERGRLNPHQLKDGSGPFAAPLTHYTASGAWRR
jgi:hypothetical protein